MLLAWAGVACFDREGRSRKLGVPMQTTKTGKLPKRMQPNEKCKRPLMPGSLRLPVTTMSNKLRGTTCPASVEWAAESHVRQPYWAHPIRH